MDYKLNQESFESWNKKGTRKKTKQTNKKKTGEIRIKYIV